MLVCGSTWVIGFVNTGWRVCLKCVVFHGAYLSDEDVTTQVPLIVVHTFHTVTNLCVLHLSTTSGLTMRLADWLQWIIRKVHGTNRPRTSWLKVDVVLGYVALPCINTCILECVPLKIAKWIGHWSVHILRDLYMCARDVHIKELTWRRKIGEHWTLVLPYILVYKVTARIRRSPPHFDSTNQYYFDYGPIVGLK